MKIYLKDIKFNMMEIKEDFTILSINNYIFKNINISKIFIGWDTQNYFIKTFNHNGDMTYEYAIKSFYNEIEIIKNNVIINFLIS